MRNILSEGRRSMRANSPRTIKGRSGLFRNQRELNGTSDIRDNGYARPGLCADEFGVEPGAVFNVFKGKKLVFARGDSAQIKGSVFVGVRHTIVRGKVAACLNRHGNHLGSSKWFTRRIRNGTYDAATVRADKNLEGSWRSGSDCQGHALKVRLTGLLRFDVEIFGNTGDVEQILPRLNALDDELTVR